MSYKGIIMVVSQGSQELYLRVRRSGPETTIGAEILVRIGIIVALKIRRLIYIYIYIFVILIYTHT